MLILFSLFLTLCAQSPATPTAPAEPAPRRAAEQGERSNREEEPVQTQHTLMRNGQALPYRTVTGTLPLKSRTGEVEGRVFFIAYTKVGVENPAQRPLLFAFNGGPGSSSVWLHLGVLGPKRVKMQEDGSLPAAPYQLIENEYTWLDKTDLVFIDPIGTGYSRPAKPELGAKFWGVRGDIESVGEFIRLYLSRYSRWQSPLFLAGESYGTTRAAGLAGYLIEKGVAFNGVCLISSVLNFQTVDFGRGNDLPYILFLPTYVATAWYHKKLPADLQRNLKQTLEEAEKWAETEYAIALQKGDRLAPAEFQRVAAQLARYTGLSQKYVESANLRLDQPQFCKELLRDQRRAIGRLDSRLFGFDASQVRATPEFDPSMATIRPPYTELFNQYVRQELGYLSDLEYYILGGGISTPWDYGMTGRSGYADTSEALRSAFAKNPYMKVWVVSGYYDLATPYFASEYTLAHMNLEAAMRKNVRTTRFEAGHMMYIHLPSLNRLKAEADSFFDWALSGK